MSMLQSKNAVTRVLVNLALMVPIACALYIGILFLQRAYYPIEVRDETITTAQPVHPGQVLDVQYSSVRRKTCTLGVSRVIERVGDRREFEIGFVTQLIDADDPPNPRLMGYRVQVPAELTTGNYRLFSRFRYYCTGLDLWSPWVYRTKPIPFKVVAP